MLLSFDSQFCFLPLCLVSCSPVRNFNYFCIFLSFYLFFFANLTFVLVFPISYSIPSVLYLSSPCCRLGSAEMHLYICVCYTICLFMKQFWWSHDFGGLRLRFLRFLCFRSTGIIQISTPSLELVMPCYADVPIDWKSSGQISPSFLTLLKPWWWSAGMPDSLLRIWSVGKTQGLGFGSSEDSQVMCWRGSGALTDQWEWMWF